MALKRFKDGKLYTGLEDLWNSPKIKKLHKKEDGFHAIGDFNYYVVDGVVFEQSSKKEHGYQFFLLGTDKNDNKNNILNYAHDNDWSLDKIMEHSKNNKYFLGRTGYDGPDRVLRDAVIFEQKRRKKLKELQSIDIESLNPTEKALYNEVIAGVSHNETNLKGLTSKSGFDFIAPTPQTKEFQKNSMRQNEYNQTWQPKFGGKRYTKALEYFDKEYYVGDKYPEQVLKQDFSESARVGGNMWSPFLFDIKKGEYSDFGHHFYKESDRYIVDKNFNMDYVKEPLYFDKGENKGELVRNKARGSRRTLDKTDFQTVEEIFEDNPEYAKTYAGDMLSYKKGRLEGTFYDTENNPYGEIAKFTGFLEDNPELYSDILKASQASGVHPSVIFTGMMQEGLIENFSKKHLALEDEISDDILYSPNQLVDTFMDWGLDATLAEQDRMNLEGGLIHPVNYFLNKGHTSFDAIPMKSYNIKDASQFRDDTSWPVGSPEADEWFRNNTDFTEEQLSELNKFVEGAGYGMSVNDLLEHQFWFERNEANDRFIQGDITMSEGLKLGAGMLQLNEKAFLQDAKKLGYNIDDISDEDKAFWTYVYYNGGSGVGRGSLNKWGLEGYANEKWDTDLAFNARRTAGNIKAMNDSGFFEDENNAEILKKFETDLNLDANDVKALISSGQMPPDTLDKVQEQIQTKFNIEDDSLNQFTPPPPEVTTPINEDEDTSWLYEEGDIEYA